MFSLIITVIAVALVAALAIATLYYGGKAMDDAGARSRAATAINQASQVLGAAELYRAEKRSWSGSVEALVASHHLKTVPSLVSPTGERAAWAQPLAGAPTYWSLRSTDEQACRQVNLKMRGDDGIYKKARPGLVTQCFGLSAPFTVVTTREAEADAPGLDVVFRFFDDPTVGYDPSGGGWAVEPTVSGNGDSVPQQPSDSGTPSGGYLGGSLQASVPGLGGVGSNSVAVGNVPSGGKVEVVVDFTNTGNNPLALTGTSACGEFKVSQTSCSGTLAPGQTCQVVVQAGPFTDVSEPRELSGCVSLGTAGGSASVGLSGTVYPSTPGGLQVGLETGDPRDSANLLVFPDTEVGQTSFKWVRVQNVGAAMNYEQPLAVVAPYSVVSSSCVSQQAPGAYCWAQLAFKPTESKLYAGAGFELTLRANGAAVTVPVSGRGIPTPPTGLSVLPANLRWSDTAATGQASMSVTLRNNGVTPLTRTSPAAITEGADAFMVKSTTCAATLAKSTSCTVTVTFFPDEARKYLGKLSFAYEQTGTHEVALEATGTNPLVRASIAALPKAIVNTPYTTPDLGAAWALATGATLDRSQLALTVANGATLPAGLELDPATRAIRGTLTRDAAPAGIRLDLSARYQGKFSSAGSFLLYSLPEGSLSGQVSTPFTALKVDDIAVLQPRNKLCASGYSSSAYTATCPGLTGRPAGWVTGTTSGDGYLWSTVYLANDTLHGRVVEGETLAVRVSQKYTGLMQGATLSTMTKNPADGLYYVIASNRSLYRLRFNTQTKLFEAADGGLPYQAGVVPGSESTVRMVSGIDAAGRLYYATNAKKLYRLTPGQAPEVMDLPTNAVGMAVTPSGQAYLTIQARHAIYRTAADFLSMSLVAGTAATYGNTDGDALTAKFYGPTTLILHEGGLYVADTGNYRVRLVR